SLRRDLSRLFRYTRNSQSGAEAPRKLKLALQESDRSYEACGRLRKVSLRIVLYDNFARLLRTAREGEANAARIFQEHFAGLIYPQAHWLGRRRTNLESRRGAKAVDMFERAFDRRTPLARFPGIWHEDRGPRGANGGHCARIHQLESSLRHLEFRIGNS